MGKLNINNGGIDTNKVMPDIDERFGPYASIEAANTALGASGRDCITAGLTVGITQGDGSVKEYWYQPDGSSLTLVPKQRLSGSPVSGDFASFDANGDIVDSGHKHSDYATAAQGTKADTAYQKPSGGVPATDLARAVQTSLGKADTAVQGVTVGTTTTGAAGTNASVSNSGTATNPVFDFTIPRGADGADGQDGADAVNPFKGWYTSSSNLPANPAVGDYAYVKGAASTDPAAIYECTTAGTWSNSGRTADTSNVQTFRTTEQVNTVGIIDGIDNGSSTDVASAATMMNVGQKLRNIPFSNVKVNIASVSKKYVKAADGTIGTTTAATVGVMETEVGDAERVRFLGAKVKTAGGSGYAFGYYNNGTWVTVLSSGWPVDGTLADPVLFEIIQEVPVSATHFRTTSNLGLPVLTDTNFYCYLEKGTLVENNLYKNRQIVSISKYDADYIVRQVPDVGGTGSVANGNRIKLLFDLSHHDFRNKKFRIRQPNGAGCSFGGHNYYSFTSTMMYTSMIGTETFYENTNYRTDVIEGVFPNKFHCDYLRFLFKKSDNSAFTDTERDTYINDFVFEVYGVDDTDESKFVTFPLSEFVSGVYINGTGGVVTSSTTKCTTKDYVALPNDNVKFKVKLPIGMAMVFGYGASGSIERQIFYFRNNEYVIFPSGATHFCACVGYYDYNNKTWLNKEITPEEVNAMVKNGDIALMYESSEILDRIDGEKNYIESSMYKYHHLVPDLDENGIVNLPIFVHASDVHGDVVRWKNILEFAKHYNVDGVINTGDNVAHSTQNGMSYLAIANDYGVRTVVAVGNHDTSDKPREGFRDDLNTNVYNEVIKPFADNESNRYILPTNSQYDDAPTYYYTDFVKSKIRVITLNLYEKDSYSTSSSDGTYSRLSQKQIDWFIGTLSSTPNGYGILLCYHRSAAPVSPDGYEKFWQELFYPQDPASGWHLANVNGYPITTIIDAFIGRNSLQTTFTQTIVDNQTETININADFTNVDGSVEFVAHVFGHHHKDSIGYYHHPSGVDSLQHMQLVLCICQSTSKYSSNYVSWANVSDIARGDGSSLTQDSFNVYAIDRTSKTVRVSRVGGNIAWDSNSPRDYMIIPYAEN